MSNILQQSPEVVAAVWKELQTSSPSKAFRTIGTRYGLDRSALGFLAADVYVDIMTPQVQAIWHWDLQQNGKGHSDEELDQLLSQLVLRSHVQGEV
jgi:hypothetical protein